MASKDNTLIKLLIPIKYACYVVFIVSVYDSTEFIDDISQLFVHI